MRLGLLTILLSGCDTNPDARTAVATPWLATMVGSQLTESTMAEAANDQLPAFEDCAFRHSRLGDQFDLTLRLYVLPHGEIDSVAVDPTDEIPPAPLFTCFADAATGIEIPTADREVAIVNFLLHVR